MRFAKPAAVLGVGEGIETMLAVAQACPNLGVWAALSTSGLKNLELPEVVREIIIAADGDDAGEQAADHAAERFIREGRTVRIAYPGRGRDFNDLIRGATT